MEICRKIRSTFLIFLLLFSALLATTLQGATGEVHDGEHLEAQCRPYVEEAIKKLETKDTPKETQELSEESNIIDDANESKLDETHEDIEITDQVAEIQDDTTAESRENVDEPQESIEEVSPDVEQIEPLEQIPTDEQSQEQQDEDKIQDVSSEKEETPPTDSEETKHSGEVEEVSKEEHLEENIEEQDGTEDSEIPQEEKEDASVQESIEEQKETEEVDSDVKTETEASIETEASTEHIADGVETSGEDKQEETAEYSEEKKSSEEDTKSIEQEEGTQSEEDKETEEVTDAESKEEQASAESLQDESAEQTQPDESAEAQAEVSAEQKDESSEVQPEASDEQADTSAEAQTDESIEAHTDASTEQEQKDASSEAQADASSEAQAEVSAEEQTDESGEAQPETSVEQEKSDTSTEAQADASTEAQTDASVEAQADASTEAQAETSNEAQAEASTEAQAESSTETQAELSAEQEQKDASSEAQKDASTEQEASTEAQADVSAEQVQPETADVPKDASTEQVEESTEKVEEISEKETESEEPLDALETEESSEVQNVTTEWSPEEELMQDFDIPTNLRPRHHINQLMHLDDVSNEEEKVLKKAADGILKELKRLYENAIKPLETLYKYRDLSNRHFGDPEIFSKPLVLFMGPWSGGKSSIINYLLDNEYKSTSLRTGAEPSPAYFNILMHGEEPEFLDGTQLAADWTFSGLQKFGQGLEERLKGLRLPSKLLEKINIVEIPGILEVRKQVSRVFPFNDACQWFIDRADIIFLVYDPSKLDVGPETEAILDQLKGREYQTRIILNKADQVKSEELMRVQGALIWNLSPLMSSAQPPVMYLTSLWSRPYEDGSPARLLQAQERSFLRDIRNAVDKRIENKISSARRFAVRVRNHAKMVDCYLTTYYNHKSVFVQRKLVADQIIDHPQDYHIYEGLSTLTNISRYDLPDPDVYRDFFHLNPLYEFQQLSATCTYFRGCPINRLDVAIAYDFPELVGKYKKLVEAALASISNSTDKS